jgi:hypothetical protein
MIPSRPAVGPMPELEAKVGHIRRSAGDGVGAVPGSIPSRDHYNIHKDSMRIRESIAVM